jgi:hypothetical protein
MPLPCLLLCFLFVAAEQPHDSDTWYLRDDTHRWTDVHAMLQITPRVLVLWRPDVHKCSGYMLKEVPADQQPADKDAACSILPSMIPSVALSSGFLLQHWQADVQNAHHGVTDVVGCSAAFVNGIAHPWATSKGRPMLKGTGLTNKMQVS